MKKIKRFLFLNLILFTVLPNTVLAQSRDYSDPIKNAERERKFKNMRLGGVGAIGLGATLFTVSTKAWQRREERKGEIVENGLVGLGKAIGIGFGQAGGVAFMAAGTAATIIANLKLDKLKRVSLTTDGNSVGLVYKF